MVRKRARAEITDKKNNHSGDKHAAAGGAEALDTDVSKKTKAVSKGRVTKKAAADSKPTSEAPHAQSRPPRRAAAAKANAAVRQQAQASAAPAPAARKAASRKPKAAAGGAKAAANGKVAGRKRAREPSAAEEQLHAVQHPSHGQVPGRLFVIGDADCGQFGLGEDDVSAPRPKPSALPDGKQVVQIATGGMHTMVLTPHGEVWTTGVNDEGALGRPTEGDVWKDSSVAKGDAYTWGRAMVPTEHGKVVQLSAGDSHSLALTELGFVYGWGTYRNQSGVYGFAPGQRIAAEPMLVWAPKAGHDQVVQIASGDDHDLALTSSGVVLSWGTVGQGQLGRTSTRAAENPRDPDKLRHSILTPAAVKLVRRGRVLARGKVTSVACGSFTSYAVTDGGKVWAWGLNQYGQLGVDSLEPHFAPIVVQSLADVEAGAVSGGQHHTLALTKEGKVLSFGRPTYGRLGRKAGVDPSKDDALPAPTQVEGIDGIRMTGTAAGIMVSGCWSEDGDVWLWGGNTNSQLGKGDDDEDELVPLKLRETKRFKAQQVLQCEVASQWVTLLSRDRPDTADPAALAAAAPAKSAGTEIAGNGVAAKSAAGAAARPSASTAADAGSGAAKTAAGAAARPIAAAAADTGSGAAKTASGAGVEAGAAAAAGSGLGAAEGAAAAGAGGTASGREEHAAGTAKRPADSGAAFSSVAPPGSSVAAQPHPRPAAGGAASAALATGLGTGLPAAAASVAVEKVRPAGAGAAGPSTVQAPVAPTAGEKREAASRLTPPPPPPLVTAVPPSVAAGEAPAAAVAGHGADVEMQDAPAANGAGDTAGGKGSGNADGDGAPKEIERA